MPDKENKAGFFQALCLTPLMQKLIQVLIYNHSKSFYDIIERLFESSLEREILSQFMSRFQLIL